MDSTETDTGERQARVGTIVTRDTTTGVLEIVFEAFCNPYFEYDEDISKHTFQIHNFKSKLESTKHHDETTLLKNIRASSKTIGESNPINLKNSGFPKPTNSVLQP